MLAVAIVAVMAMGMASISTGIAGNIDTGLPFFAQKSNGQGNNNENPPQAPGTGNNGQGQGQENGNPPENPGEGNNSQGQGNPPANPGQGNPPENPAEGNNGQGQDNPPAADDVDDGEDDAATDDDTDAGVQARGNAPEKVNVCHVDQESGNVVMISISENAVPAHERHGDEAIDVAAEDECPEPEAPEDPAPATPIATPDVG